MPRKNKKVKTPLTSKIKKGDTVVNTNPGCKHFKSKGKVKGVKKLPNIPDGKGGKNMPGKLIHYKDKKTGKDLYKTGDQLKNVKKKRTLKEWESHVGSGHKPEGNRLPPFKEWVVNIDPGVLLEKKLTVETEPTCKDFIKFCRKKLKVKSPIKINFIKELTDDLTTGGYHPGDKKITVYTKDRALVDILRSIAHELVHQKQDGDKLLITGSGDTGSKHENEANALAGIIMREYQEDNRNIY